MISAQAPGQPSHVNEPVQSRIEPVQRHDQVDSKHDNTLCWVALCPEKSKESTAAATTPTTDAAKPPVPAKAFEGISPSVLDKTGRPMIVDGKFDPVALTTQYDHALDAIGKLDRSVTPDRHTTLAELAAATLTQRADITGERINKTGGPKPDKDAIDKESKRIQGLNPNIRDDTNLQGQNVVLYDDKAIDKISDDTRFKFIPQAGQFAKLAHAKELHGKADEDAFENHITQSDNQLKDIYKKYALPQNPKDSGKPSLDPKALEKIADGTEKSDLISPALAAQALKQNNQLYLLDVMASNNYISKDEQTAALRKQSETSDKMILNAINRELVKPIETPEQMTEMMESLGLQKNAKPQALLDKLRAANHAFPIRTPAQNRPALENVETRDRPANPD